MPLAARYAIVDRLAEVDGWSLWRARPLADGAPALIELLDPARGEAYRLERLRRAQEIAAVVEGGPVLRPVELGTWSGRPALVHEDFDGAPLSALLDGRVGLEVGLSIAVALADALATLHRVGVVHRALRPEGVLVARDGAAVRLADLGLAGAPARAATLAAPALLVEAALPWIAPEQTGRMNAAVDGRADLYALGLVLYRLLTGRPAFVAHDALEWVHCHVARVPPAPADVAPDVPPQVSDVVMKLLAKMPDDRYQAATGLRHDLGRCLEALRAGGAVEPFSLGDRDRSERLQLPQRLYGRGEELLTLLRAFHRASPSGRPGLVLVTGGAGVGKSALVLELQKRIAGEPGLFVAAKFDASGQDIPYSTFVRALRDLVLAVVARGPAQVAVWRERILAAVGGHGRVLVDVFPALESVLGPQPPVPALPPEEARNRLSLLLRRFVSVFAREAPPVVIFLDDLHWADAGALALLRDLISDADTGPLLLVGAYRDGEVAPGHPLLRTVAEIRAAGAPVETLALRPLSDPELGRFVQDALRCDPGEAGALAALVAEKTAGNPFFAIQFLTELHDERLVAFDAARGRWEWDLGRIQAKGFTDSVVDLILAKLRRLPPRTAAVVERAASIGAATDLGTLAAVNESSEEETRTDLEGAVEAGLVVAAGDGYRLVHDRVQEAAYALLPPGARAAAHLRAGRLLLTYHRGERLGQRIFEVVNQLDRGLELVRDPDERAEILDLNLQAARKARGAGAFESARGYFRHAAALLPRDAWELRPDATFDLELELAECEYLGGAFDAAHALLDELLARARDRRQRARACGLRMRLFQVSGRWADAVAVALEALRAFGVTFPDSEAEATAATQAAIADLPRLMRGRSIAALADAPLAADPDVRATIALLVTVCPATNVARPALFPLAVLAALRLSLEHGNTEESCFAYSAWACLLVSLVGDVPSAYAFSRMSLRLNERLGDARLEGTLLYLHGSFVHFWSEPFSTVFAIQDRALEACLQAGDLVFAGYLAAHRTNQLVESGRPLDEVVSRGEEHARRARLGRSEWMADTIGLLLLVPRCLQGLTRSPGLLDDEAFSLARYRAACAANGFATGVALTHVADLTAAAFFGRWDEALAAADAIEPLLGSIAAQASEYAYHSYAAVAAAVLTGRAPESLRPQVAAILARELPRVERFATACPANFGALLALVRAELARADGRDAEAIRLYEEAVAGARAAGFTHREALANELAAAFHRERGLDRLAGLYLREAHDAYRRWGAHAKARALEERHPALMLRPRPVAAGEGARLDLLSVVKASQTISREIVADRLVGTLLQVALELGGARRACLVLARGDDLAVEAEALQEPDGVATRLVPSEPLATSSRVPAALVRRAWLGRQAVLVEDAASEADPTAEPYFAHRPVRSLLALPLGQQARIVGVLYLENDLVAGVFTSDRLTALELLGFQAAISVENARLFEEARRTGEALAAANAKLTAEMREREQAEAARAAAEVELRQAQKMQSVGLLAGGVAHDFNNLLTPILGNAECLAADLPADHPDAELVAEIRDAAGRARDLTRQLLAVGRRQMLELERVDLGALVRRFERMIRRVVREDIRIDVVLPPDLGAVRADAGQIGQVLLNLAVNAQDAMPGAGVLTLAARDVLLDAGHVRPEGLEPGAYVVLSVVDTGTGMDAETRERLFEPFFTTKKRGKGTGLGLSTAYGIVRQHGGTVVVRSEPGRGATFEVYLPQAPGASATATATAPAPEVARGAGETVLVVEDDAAVRRTACALLQRLGYAVLAADGLEDGERQARARGGRIDLLLSDIVMPRGNGKQVFERLREACPGLRVLYMSGYASDVIVHRGVVDEGVDFIQKPLELDRLGAKVRQVLDR